MRTTVANLAQRIQAVQRPGHRTQGMVQEWFTDDGAPPLCLLSHMANRGRRGLAVWVGRRVWPMPWRGFSKWILIDPPDPATRLWATDLALRSGGVATVVADGSGFDMAATRRLQLAAEAGGAVALLARPITELRELSAATMRFHVRPQPSPNAHPRWRVDRLRDKRSTTQRKENTLWLEYDDVTGAVGVPADVVRRPGAEEAEAAIFRLAS